VKRHASLLLLLAVLPAAASAHGGAHLPSPAAPGWTLDPGVVAPLLLCACLYAVGFVRLWSRSEGGRVVHRRKAWLFVAGWLTLAAAIISPLHEAGERSFTLHMIEHELIMGVAALLLAVSRPLAMMLWGLPAKIRQALAGLGRKESVAAASSFVSHPVPATLVQALVLILWHAPPLFNRALGHAGWHVAQHLCFLVSALIFWWSMARRQGARGYALASLCLFATSLIGGGLGALMAFASSPWYAGYAALGMMPFGLTPVEDQQLAGLVMWIPGGMIHAVAALVLLARALRRKEAPCVPAID
jgi:putative membrane protein